MSIPILHNRFLEFQSNIIIKIGCRNSIRTENQAMYQDFLRHVSPLFSPNHLVHHPRIALNQLHNLGRYILIRIIGHRQAIVLIPIHLHGSIYSLKQGFPIKPARTKIPLSRASGRSVLVRMHTAGKGCPTEVKKLLSSGRVPLSLTTA